MKNQESTLFIGVDYGSKLAGTTVVCYNKEGQLHFLQSEKKKDADAFLKNFIQLNRPAEVFMDAPLSLPGVYTQKGDDYFYRQCDRLVGGMSPMFLGGLTARAMKLRAAFSSHPFFEIYPAQLVRVLWPDQETYKKDLAAFCELLRATLPLSWAHQPQNWHQADAALGWYSGWRYHQQTAISYGRKEEGLIIV